MQRQRAPLVRIPELENEILEFQGSLLAFAMSLTKQKVTAEDLYQDTYIKAISNQHLFERGSNLKAWLFTIMRNEWYSKLRKSKRERPLSDAIVNTTPARREDVEFEDNDEIAKNFLQIVPFLATIPKEQCDSMIAVHYLGYSYEVTAEIFEAQIGTIKSRVSRGISAISSQMSNTEVRSCDISAWATATLHVPRHHAYFCIAEAYEEIYAYVHGRSFKTQFTSLPPQSAESEVDALYRGMLESGVLDDEFELEGEE